MGKGKVQVRIQNLADKFDELGPQEQISTPLIDMNQFAKDLYIEANLGATKAPQFKITELSLSGNQLYKDNEEYKLHNVWKGEDDGQISESMSIH